MHFYCQWFVSDSRSEIFQGFTLVTFGGTATISSERRDGHKAKF